MEELKMKIPRHMGDMNMIRASLDEMKYLEKRAIEIETEMIKAYGPLWRKWPDQMCDSEKPTKPTT